MRLILVAVLTSTALVYGCGVSGPIAPAKNPSGFEGAVYSGRTDTLNKPTNGVESFRVFNQAATGFSTADAQMGDAYERATRFCTSNGKKMRALEESRSTGLHVLGNFPRAELVFDRVIRELNTSKSRRQYLQTGETQVTARFGCHHSRRVQSGKEKGVFDPLAIFGTSISQQQNNRQ